jgi:ABC-type transport system substrate-binding protein
VCQAIRKNVEEFWKNPVGTGPFRFDSWDIGSRLSLKKNASWWGGSVPVSEGGGGPHLKRVVFQPIPDNTSRFAALTGYSFSRGPCSTCKISTDASLPGASDERSSLCTSGLILHN